MAKQTNSKPDLTYQVFGAAAGDLTPLLSLRILVTVFLLSVFLIHFFLFSAPCMNEIRGLDSPIVPFIDDIDRHCSRQRRIRETVSAPVFQQHIEMANEPPPSMAVIFAPLLGNHRPSIVVPDNVRSFDIKGHLMALLPKFYGQKNEDVMGFLLEMELFIGNLAKGEGVTDNDLRMKVFPLCLHDKARTWMNGLDEGSLTTWPQV